jgi:hypothetical protein|tara:strand:+ start:263 stop:469 length:207 start_codon:yes stop_codon:yes gene_type:complete
MNKTYKAVKHDSDKAILTTTEPAMGDKTYTEDTLVSLEELQEQRDIVQEKLDDLDLQITAIEAALSKS